MAPLGILLDERFKQHDTGYGHPERPARLDAVAAGLNDSGLLDRLVRIEPEPIDLALLEQVHAPSYVQRVRAACEAGVRFIDTPDSAICRESYDVARLAAGGVVRAATQIGRGELQRAFCAVRPPGHHAEYDASMGFCLFANVVLAARALQREGGLERVLILDWDVHHGNGTQHLLEDDPSVMFISLHGDPRFTYPGTGFAEERGRGAGEGFTLNIPFMPGASDAEYRAAFDAQVMPKAEAFRPQAVIISAGFDAHADDPLANIELTDAAFAWMLRRTIEIADRHADGRVLSVLEGGYNLDVLRRCVAEHVRILSGGGAQPTS